VRRPLVSTSSSPRTRQILTIFFSLQVLDILTTLAGLRAGASEGSLFIGRLLAFGPLTGLVISKALALGLAAYAAVLQRERLLRFVNFWFAGVVARNLVVINAALQQLG